MVPTTHDVSVVFIELGAAIVGLAVLARIASRWGFSAIPLYLLAGLAFGNGGLAPLNVRSGFIHIGGEIGVVLLLFMSGLEYTGQELKENLRGGLPAGIVDLALNFPPVEVDGDAVILTGQVTRPTLKAVKKIEGVSEVINRIQVLPPSPMDDRIRPAVFGALYSGDSPLFRYGVGSQYPIHIIVNGGHVSLEGIVANEMDRKRCQPPR